MSKRYITRLQDRVKKLTEKMQEKNVDQDIQLDVLGLLGGFHCELVSAQEYIDEECPNHDS